ncbi:MAG: hypothetical protein ACR2HX_08265 [Pyrinomonadaceae bacterium]
MADEERTDNHRVRILFDEDPFNSGLSVKIVGVGDAVVDVLAQFYRSPFKHTEVIRVSFGNSLRQPRSTHFADALPSNEAPRATILTTGHKSYGFQSPTNYHARTDGARVSAAWLK